MKTTEELIAEVDDLTKRIWGQMEDATALARTILKLVVLNVGLGNKLQDALDLERQAETQYKHGVEKAKLRWVEKGDSATVAESKAKVEAKEVLDELNGLRSTLDLLKIKRHDTQEVVNAAKIQINLIKEESRVV